jgi:hypothetical protein
MINSEKNANYAFIRISECNIFFKIIINKLSSGANYNKRTFMTPFFYVRNDL